MQSLLLKEMSYRISLPPVLLNHYFSCFFSCFLHSSLPGSFWIDKASQYSTFLCFIISLDTSHWVLYSWQSSPIQHYSSSPNSTVVFESSLTLSSWRSNFTVFIMVPPDSPCLNSCSEEKLNWDKNQAESNSRNMEIGAFYQSYLSQSSFSSKKQYLTDTVVKQISQ